MTRTANPWAVWNDLTTTTTEMMVASAEVIADRSLRMARASTPPSGKDQREFSRMMDEKVEAGQEAAQAMANSWLTTQGRSATDMWSHAFGFMPMMMAMATSTTPAQAFSAQMNLMNHMMKPMLDPASAFDAISLTHKAMKPYHGRAQANVKRLRAERLKG